MNVRAQTTTFEPDVVVLYCGHCVREDRGIAAALENVKGFSAKSAMFSCSSQIEVSHVLKILEQGADGVEVVACPEGACKSLVGSARAEKRISYAKTLLNSIHTNPERLGISRRKIGVTADNMVELAAGRADAVRALGPNHMKNGGNK